MENPSEPVNSIPAAVDRIGFRDVDGNSAVRATGRWWTANADEYLAEHGEFLGTADFCWGPEGLREAEAKILGNSPSLRGLQVLEIGAGAAQCSRYLARDGIDVTATDISEGMCRRAVELNEEHQIGFPVVVSDARTLPFPDDSFDIVFSSFGVVPFVPDLGVLNREVARVLRSGGRWVYSTTHPIRWAFADDPESVTAIRSYFDRRPYVEADADGQPLYVEYHHRLSDHIEGLVTGGFAVCRLLEPPWPDDLQQTWGGWGPVRGEYLPGTIIIDARLTEHRALENQVLK